MPAEYRQKDEAQPDFSAYHGMRRQAFTHAGSSMLQFPIHTRLQSSQTRSDALQLTSYPYGDVASRQCLTPTPALDLLHPRRPRDVVPIAKSAAETALKLDDTLADAHAAMGFIHLFYDWNGPAAERELTRAIELNPSSSAARINHAGYFLATGKREQAVPEIRNALQLDPLSPRTHALGTIFLIFALHYDEAIEQARKALESEPRFGPALAFQGLAFAEQGRFTEAVESLEKAAQLDKSAMVGLFRAHVHAVAGNKERAQKLVREIEESSEIGYLCPYEVATAYVSLRENDKAYQWLRKGIEERADCMAWLGVEPWMEPFRSDPRYNEVLREVGLAKSSPDKPSK